MSVYSEEYKDLLAAQRAIRSEIDNPTEDTNLAMLSRALVDLVQQKRYCRGLPNPRPQDMQPKNKRRSPQSVAPCEDAPAPKPTIPQG